MDAIEAGRLLAERHRQSVDAEYDFSNSLLNYAEFPYKGDWTLRSALVRLAQPEPARVGALLEVVRRLDGPLHHAKRGLERAIVTCDRALAVNGLAGLPAESYPDVRAADLARLAAAGFDDAEVLAGYEESAPEHGPLEHEERLSVPLLVVALEFAGLSAQLAAWALAGPESPPVEAVDQIVARTTDQLDHLGVPVETGPPPGAGRSRGT